MQIHNRPPDRPRTWLLCEAEQIVKPSNKPGQVSEIQDGYVRRQSEMFCESSPNVVGI